MNPKRAKNDDDEGQEPQAEQQQEQSPEEQQSQEESTDQPTQEDAQDAEGPSEEDKYPDQSHITSATATVPNPADQPGMSGPVNPEPPTDDPAQTGVAANLSASKTGDKLEQAKQNREQQQQEGEQQE